MIDTSRMSIQKAPEMEMKAVAPGNAVKDTQESAAKEVTRPKRMPGKPPYKF